MNLTTVINKYWKKELTHYLVNALYYSRRRSSSSSSIYVCVKSREFHLGQSGVYFTRIIYICIVIKYTMYIYTIKKISIDAFTLKCPPSNSIQNDKFRLNYILYYREPIYIHWPKTIISTSVGKTFEY